MLRSGYILAVLVTAMASAASPAFAWGQTGHRVTGELAEQYLSKKARRAVHEILGEESLAEASTWADFMRASDEPFWQQEAPPYHYVTVPAGKSYADVGAPPEGDAITALAKFASVLKDSSATRDEKALALRFTIHIIGDLHQPLHAGNGADRGGNDFKVVFYGEPSNLHSVWDSGLIDREALSFSEWALWLGPKISKRDVAAWSSADPEVWVAESVALRDTIYPTSANLSWGYGFEHIDAVRLRLSQGGVRVAAYLNALFE